MGSGLRGELSRSTVAFWNLFLAGPSAVIGISKQHSSTDAGTRRAYLQNPRRPLENRWQSEIGP